REQIATGAVGEPCCVCLDFIPRAADHRVFMTFGAGGGVEKRSQAIFGFKDSLEDFLSLKEFCPLLRSEVGPAFAQLRLVDLATTQTQQQAPEHPADYSYRFHTAFPFFDSVRAIGKNRLIALLSNVSRAHVAARASFVYWLWNGWLRPYVLRW